MVDCNTLINNIKTENEINKERELLSLINNFCSKTMNLDFNIMSEICSEDNIIGYSDKCGYYIINIDSKGRLFFSKGYPTKDRDLICYQIIKYILSEFASDLFIHSRMDISSKKIYHVFIINYLLDKFNIFFEGNIPDYIINDLKNDINNLKVIQESDIEFRYNNGHLEPTNKVKKIERA